MLPMIEKIYDGNERLQRDEAIRSASLAAMTLMYAAKNRGWATGPMIGFDQDVASKLLKLTPEYIPVMLLVLGHQKNEGRPRDYRRPIDEVVKFNTLDGPGLKG
jgi:putative NAD(P)H nitroreductase